MPEGDYNVKCSECFIFVTCTQERFYRIDFKLWCLPAFVSMTSY